MNVKPIQNCAQQGDVTLIKIPALPDSGKTIARKRCVLAHGESGHSHVLEHPSAKLVTVGDRKFLTVTKSAAVIHEEHKPITITPGIWEVGQVSEYDYFSDMARAVVD